MSLSLIKSTRWPLGLLIGLIGLSLLLLLPGIAKYHSDECFYTDAAIRMSQTGDILTPYAANGALRFNKPILPYWAVLAGYAVFGINFLGSRFFFMVAGCLTILLTYRLSFALFKRHEEALLAALIAASNVQLLTTSIRSTPDALLCASCVLSLLGFARVIFQEDRSWWNYALAWVGAALAIETRGLPGIAVALFPFIYCLIFRRHRTRLRNLFEWKATTLSLLVAISWFALMVWLHGQALIDGFYYDQVTGNVQEYELLSPLKNLQSYGVGVLRHFLPWSFLLALALILDRRVAASAWREHRDKAWFLLGWFVFILAPFLFGGFHRTRYMVIAYPALSVLLAMVFTRYGQEPRFGRWLAGLLRLGAVLWVLAGTGLIAMGVVVHPRIIVGGSFFLAGGVAIWTLSRRALLGSAVGAALLALSAFWAIEFGWRPVFARSPAPDLVARLAPEGASGQRVYAVNVTPSIQAQMRVLSHGKLRVSPISVDALAAMSGAEYPVVFGEDTGPLPGSESGRVEQVGFANRKWRARDLLALFDEAKRKAAQARNLAPYYVLFPAPDSDATP